MRRDALRHDSRTPPLTTTRQADVIEQGLSVTVDAHDDLSSWAFSDGSAGVVILNRRGTRQMGEALAKDNDMSHVVECVSGHVLALFRCDHGSDALGERVLSPAVCNDNVEQFLRLHLTSQQRTDIVTAIKAARKPRLTTAT